MSTKAVERSRTPEDLQDSTMPEAPAADASAAPAGAPKLKKMTNFEIIMRNNTVYHPDVIQPPVVINGMAELEKPLCPKTARAELEKVCETFGRWGAVTKDDGNFEYVGPKAMDWDYHLQAGPNFQTEKEQAKAVDEIFVQGLDFDKPLWRSYHGTLANGNGYLFVRIHHCLGDGVAIDTWVRHVCKTQEGRAMSQVNPLMKKYEDHKKKGVLAKIGSCLCFSLLWPAKMCKVLCKAGDCYPFETDSAWTNPRRRKKWKGTAECQFVRFPELDLNKVKEVKQHFSKKGKGNYTINDVLYGVTSGMVRRYCEKKGDTPDKLDKIKIRALIAVAFPRDTKSCDQRDTFTNKFAIPPLPMPVSCKTAEERIDRAKQINSELKG